MGAFGHGDERSPEPRRVGEVIRRLAGSGAFGRGLALGRLSRSWEEVVGAPLAAETAPAALDERGLLVVASTPARGAQVRFLAEEIRRKANRIVGGEGVPAVRVSVGPVAPKKGSHLGR